MKKCISQKGAAIVEFALILPLFLILVFGIIEFGLIMYDQAVITNASREAARSGIAYKDPKLTTAEIQAVAANYCNGRLISFGGGTTCPAGNVTVTPSPTPTAAGASLTVTVSYTYNFLLFGNLLALLPGGSSMSNPTLSATTVMNNE